MWVTFYETKPFVETELFYDYLITIELLNDIEHNDSVKTIHVILIKITAIAFKAVNELFSEHMFCKGSHRPR